MTRSDAAFLLSVSFLWLVVVAIVVRINWKKLKKGNMSDYEAYMFLLRVGDFRSVSFGSADFWRRLSIFVQAFAGCLLIAILAMVYLKLR